MSDEENQVAQEAPAAAENAVEALPEPSPEEVLKTQLDELNDRYMRMLAETENYKKRVARERSEERAYAAQETIQMFLPISDNLERALEAVPLQDRTEGAIAPLAKGVELTMRQFGDALRRLGVEPIEAEIGKPFNPHFHQALFHEDSAEHEEGTILLALQKGYKMGDRVLRPSMVKVSRKP